MKTVINFVGGKMNKDLDERLVPPGDYVDALNVRTGSTESTEVGSVEKSRGNEKVAQIYWDPSSESPISKDAKCIGVFKDDSNEIIYWFIHDFDPGGSYPVNDICDLIVSYNTTLNSTTYHVIDLAGVLNFSYEYPITGVSLVENLLFWTDGLNPPRRIDVTATYSGVTSGEVFNVIVKPPTEAPSITLTYIPNLGNFLEENFIAFSYRYKYANGEYSALSQFSEIAFVPSDFLVDPSTYLNEGMINQYNAVNIEYNSGSSLVKEIEICYKKGSGNEIKVIQRLNKQELSIADNSTQTFLFSNNKIYTTLPSSEWFRLYDNVPHKAKAQAIMGNRLMYGNYVEGYNLIDADNNKVNLTYSAQPYSEEILSTPMSTTLSSYTYPAGWYTGVLAATITNAKFRIDVPTEYQNNIPEGLIFSFTLTLESAQVSTIGFPNQAAFSITFTFTTQKTYSSWLDMVNSTEFQKKMGTTSAFYQSANGLPNVCTGFSLTDRFACAIQNKGTSPAYIKYAVGSTTTLKTGFVWGFGSNTFIDIVVPGMAYQNVSTLAIDRFEWFRVQKISATISKAGVPKSLHSNRDYQLGIVYMDEYNRSTTALTSPTNTVFFPAGNSSTKNRIKVTIPISQKAPSWAKRYKFVIKPTKERYDTIFANIFYNDPMDNGIWVKLDGESQNKVSVGDKLIVKSDTQGALQNYVTTVVLDKEAKPVDWISGNQTPSGQPIQELPGVYMRVKADGWSANFNPSNYIDTGSLTAESTDTGGGNPNSYASIRIPCFGYTNGVVERWTIPAGSVVTINLWVFRFGRNCGGATNDCGRVDSLLHLKIVASQNYSDFKNFWDGEGVNVAAAVHPDYGCPDDAGQNNDVYFASLGFGVGYVLPPSQGTNRYRFAQDSATTSSSTPLYLTIRHGSPACSWPNVKTSRIEARIIIQKAGGALVFETEPTDAIPDLYYENHESFGIDNSGNHLCNDVSQDIAGGQSGISYLNFYNCFAFGNGVESYKIKDSIIGDSFSLGQRVTSVAETDFSEVLRFSDITYSGVYNRESNVNKLNEFNLGLLNFKNLEAAYASIQKMHPRQTDLLVFQEDRVSRVLVGKNILSDSTGGGTVTSVPEVLGNQVARIEEFGICKQPESFASFGNDLYFTDIKKGAVLKLSGEQLFILSDIGMRSYFRDSFKPIKSAPVRGAYDPFVKDYVLHVGDEPAEVLDYIKCGGEKYYGNITTQTTIRVYFPAAVGDVDIYITGPLVGDGDVTVFYNNTPEGAPINIATGGSLTFAKYDSTINYADIVVIPTSPPAGFLLTTTCPSGGANVTVYAMVLTNKADAGKVGQIAYGTYPNNMNVEAFVAQATAAYPSISYLSTQTLSPGSLFLPPNSSPITMYGITGQFNDFNINPSIDRFRLLRSNTLYAFDTPSGFNSLITAAGAITTTPVGPVADYEPYESYSASMLIGASGQYLYLIWDYRRSVALDMCYHATIPASACCNCNIPCPTCVEVQTTGVFTSPVDACNSRIVMSLYYSGGGIAIDKQFYYDNSCTFTAYPGFYSYYDTVFRWFELNSSGVVIKTGNC
jgi:hypothetical protein